MEKEIAIVAELCPLILGHELFVVVGARFGGLHAVVKDLKAAGSHHRSEAQDFTGEGAVTELWSCDSVRNTWNMEPDSGHLKNWGGLLFRLKRS